MQAQIKKDGKVIIRNVRVYNTFFKRLQGLMFKKTFSAGGILLVPCRQIHTFFMSFPIAVVFIDRQGIVIEAVPLIEPGKVSRLYKKCHQVLELPPESLAKHRIEAGNILEIVQETVS